MFLMRPDCDNDTRSKVLCGALSDDVTIQCVGVRNWCDGSADCDDASDETLCNTGRKVIRSLRSITLSSYCWCDAT